MEGVQGSYGATTAGPNRPSKKRGQKRKAPYSVPDRTPNPTTAVPTVNNMKTLNDVDLTQTHQVQSTVTVPTTKPTNDTTDEHESATGRQDIHASEKVAKLIEQYCDPSKWTDQESREGFMDYEVEEDGFAPNAYGDGDSDEDEDENQRSFLTPQERFGLIKLLSGSDTEDPVEKVRRWAPKGLVLSGKQLMAAIHPDRFPQADQKQMAHKAFVRVDEALHGNRAAEIKGLNEGDSCLVDFLEDYHKEAHVKATADLIGLYEAFRRGDSIDAASPSLAKEVKTAYDNLDAINDQIRTQNMEIHNDPEFGVIELDQLTNCWKQENRKTAPVLLWKLCEVSHYPMGWAYQPPREDYTYDLERGEYWAAIRSRITTTLEHFWNTFLQDYLENTSDNVVVQEILAAKAACENAITESNVSSGRPEQLNIVDLEDIMAHYCGLKYFLGQSLKEQFDNLVRHLKGRLVSWQLPEEWLPNQSSSTGQEKKEVGSELNPRMDGTLQARQIGQNKYVIPIKPRTVDGTADPGFTRYKEKIIAYLPIGAFSARYVIEAEDGTRLLVNSGRAGGKQVLPAAKEAGVPRTISSRDIGRILGTKRWKLTYVAAEEWNISRLNEKGEPKMPLIVAGISTEEGDYHVARASMHQVAGAQAFDNIIVESLGGQKDESLADFLMRQLPSNGSSVPKNLEKHTDELRTLKDDIEWLKTTMSQLVLHK
ncbi:hypothetical protein UA08_09458 [Talaromyces atroroseus]|uniref:Uncharacterized protein n=1 Tax=Talaromyces atroroseus TaxID=1441469 RepID=A0A225A9R2_TALAT|nr:hypothetical protein UA08_09458 [Talaromyces atroroseus]OKL55303.1 hypothetical protein UA08_09458 [Talaromyces atroroseus]